MSRNLLHFSKLDAFKAWLTAQGIEHRPGKGPYQDLQVRTKGFGWRVVHSRASATEHHTVDPRLEPLVHRFISETRNAE